MGLEPRVRDYEAECRDAALPSRACAQHPLQVAGSGAEAGREEGALASESPRAQPAAAPAVVDPLTAALLTADFDPLGAAGGGRGGRGAAVDHNPIGVTDKAPRQRDLRRGAGPRAHAPREPPPRPPHARADRPWRLRCADAKVTSSALFEDPVASEEWDAKKQHILNRFAVQGNITVNATFDIVGRAKRGCAARRARPPRVPRCGGLGAERPAC
jgi:hypothetical protein